MPNKVHSVWKSRGTQGTGEKSRAGTTKTRIAGCTYLRCAGDKRWRNSCLFCNSRGTGSVQPTASSRSTNGVSHERLDLRLRFSSRNLRHCVRSFCFVNDEDEPKPVKRTI